MKCLLDTHIFLWMAAEPEKLSAHAQDYISNADNTLYLSIVSLWEMQIKRQLGKLEIDVPLDELWHQQQIQSELLLLLTKEEHIWELGTLPPLHKDPFDVWTRHASRLARPEDYIDHSSTLGPKPF